MQRWVGVTVVNCVTGCEQGSHALIGWHTVQAVLLLDDGFEFTQVQGAILILVGLVYYIAGTCMATILFVRQNMAQHAHHHCFACYHSVIVAPCRVCRNLPDLP